MESDGILSRPSQFSFKFPNKIIKITQATQFISALEVEHGFRHSRDGNRKATEMEMNQFPARNRHVNIRKVKLLQNYHLQSVDKML